MDRGRPCKPFFLGSPLCFRARKHLVIDRNHNGPMVATTVNDACFPIGIASGPTTHGPPSCGYSISLVSSSLQALIIAPRELLVMHAAATRDPQPGRHRFQFATSLSIMDGMIP